MAQCTREGYTKTICPSGQKLATVCPYNNTYYKECCSVEYKYNAGGCTLENNTQSKESCGGKYRCYCDTALFPYARNDTTSCKSPKRKTGEKCISNTADGVTFYYSECKCPSTYSETCTGLNQKGEGTGCTENGVTKYKSCTCKDGYILTCSDLVPVTPNDYCLQNGIKYYKSCKTCANECTLSACPTGVSCIQEACSQKFCDRGACISGYINWCTKPTTDCTALGYTMTAAECSGLPTIKCPLDISKLFCKKALPITCTVGSAIYGDGKCYDIYRAPSNVKPVGVVFDATKRLAIALNAVKKDGSVGAEGIKWMSTGCDLTGLSNCSNYKTCWTDGSTNMLSLSKKCTGSCTCNAINAAKLYQPTGCSATFCSKGKWFIPSMLEMETYYNSSAVKDTLQQLTNMGYAQAGSNQIPQNWFTLSTTIDSYGMLWGIWSGQVTQSAHIATVPVWPVVKY